MDQQTKALERVDRDTNHRRHLANEEEQPPSPRITIGVDRTICQTVYAYYRDGVKVREVAGEQQVICNPVGANIDESNQKILMALQQRYQETGQ